MKILLIEYEPRYLERIRGYLAGKDFELVVARDGDEGLEHYRRSRPDLVLVSSVLPRLRTPDVIRGMQAAGSTPPILLMMSGYKGRNKRADAQRIGATSILEKPFGEEIFNAEIQAALGLHPVLDLPPSGSVPESGEPLLSADDIFSDVLSGIDEDVAVAAPPAAPPPSPLPPPGIDPALQRRLETTLSGLIPPRKGESSPGFVRPRSDAPRTSGEVPAPGTAETMKVNLGELAPGDRPPERAKSGAGTAASVDKLLHDTLSGLRIKSKPGTGSGLTDPGVTTPSRPVSGASAPALSPSAVPAPEPSRERVVPPPIAPAPALLPSDATPLAPLPVNTIATPAPPPPAPVRIPSRTPRPPSGPGAFGRYQLLERIASGGMADVFKARMTGEEGFEKIVAIKRILPHLATNEGFITMFVDEAKLAAQLSHNNIIHIYELGKVDAWHYIAMEYVDGKDLRSIVKMGRDRSFPLPVELSLFIASRIANALDYAHRRVAPDGTELNLVHRDVSPQNILISWEGDIKLCDFGVAKAATKVSTTMSGALKGKLQYMSPEQAWGKKIDRRSDIFSLGAVLFELLTGLPLFEGENDMTILEKVRDGQVEPPSARNPEVPRKVDQIVLKALAKNALDRYQNASELEKDLLSVLYGYQPSPGPADLAIYVHRLLEAPHSTSDDDIDAAFAAAQQPLETTPSPKKGRGLVLAKSGEHTQPALTVPTIAPVTEARPMAVPSRKETPRPIPVVGARAALPVGGESKKSRAGLFAGIGIAAVALVAAGVYFARGRGSAPAPAVPAPVPPSTVAAPATAAPAPASAPEAMKVVDPKAVEAEAKRLAAETEKARREAEKKAAAGKTGTPAATAPALSLAANAPAEPPKAAEAPSLATAAPAPAAPATAAPAAAPAPTVVAVAAPPTAPTAEAARPVPTEVSVPQAPPPVPEPVAEKPNVGDLVGPGAGVVEPKLVRLGGFTGLPAQARQMAHTSSDGSLGITVLMGLVDENGNVIDIRLIRPSAYKFADEAAIRSLRSAKITPATKDGVRVKMWSTFPITVKP